MPSQRKRIGFLPSKEVHEIIDRISNENRISQSKVTGILVEEALRSRGIFNPKYHKDNISYILNNYSLKDDLKKSEYFSDIKNKEIIDDVKMINEFIEYKLFKKIMNQSMDYTR